jgi:hypothetical protein
MTLVDRLSVTELTKQPTRLAIKPLSEPGGVTLPLT